MPVYLVKTPTGKRVVQADTQKSAINHVMKSEVEIEPLSAVQLADLMAEGDLKIEKVAGAAPKVDENQTDLEDTIKARDEVDVTEPEPLDIDGNDDEDEDEDEDDLDDEDEE